MLIYYLLLAGANDKITAERGKRCEEGITTGNKFDAELVFDSAVSFGFR